jgi:hypothetical protein
MPAKPNTHSLFAVVQSRQNNKSYLVHREVDHIFLERTFTLTQAMLVAHELTHAAYQLALSRRKTRTKMPTPGALRAASRAIDPSTILQAMQTAETHAPAEPVVVTQTPTPVPVRAEKLTLQDYLQITDPVTAWTKEVETLRKQLANASTAHRRSHINMLIFSAEAQLAEARANG